MKISVYSNIGKETIEIPDRWEMVTVDQYQRLYSEWDASDLVKLFSILTGQDYQELFDRVDPHLEKKLIECTGFVSAQDFRSDPVPKTIKIGAREIEIPKRIAGLSIGQSIHVRQKMTSAKVIEEMISYTTALYLQPLYDRGPFNHDLAMELHGEILKMPITKVFPIGFFLLKRLTGSGQSLTSKVKNIFTRFIQASLTGESR